MESAKHTRVTEDRQTDNQVLLYLWISHLFIFQWSGRFKKYLNASGKFQTCLSWAPLIVMMSSAITPDLQGSISYASDDPLTSPVINSKGLLDLKQQQLAL